MLMFVNFFFVQDFKTISNITGLKSLMYVFYLKQLHAILRSSSYEFRLKSGCGALSKNLWKGNSSSIMEDKSDFSLVCCLCLTLA